MTRTIGFDYDAFQFVKALSASAADKKLKKTPQFRVINEMLNLAREVVMNEPIDFLEDWELESVVKIIGAHHFQQLDPGGLWMLLARSNPELSEKVRGLNTKEQSWLLLRVLYERKKH